VRLPLVRSAADHEIMPPPREPARTS
jgi:hypothetical protein